MERLVGKRVIRAARLSDLDAIEQLETEAFASDRLSRRSLRRFLTAPTTETPVAEDDGGLAGYAMIGFRAGSGVGRIFSLAVAQRVVRRGVGRELLQACETAARRRGRARLRLEVRADNAAAIGLYERVGYARWGVLADYYEDGATALRLNKSIEGDV